MVLAHAERMTLAPQLLLHCVQWPSNHMFAGGAVCLHPAIRYTANNHNEIQLFMMLCELRCGKDDAVCI